MFEARPRRVAIVLAVLAVSACAPVGLEAGPAPVAPTPAPSATASRTATPTPTATAIPTVAPTPTPVDPPSATPSPSTPQATESATPAGDPSALVPGANHIGSASAYTYPAQLVQQWLEGEVKPTEKIVFLTFDDGPNPKTTPIILEALKDAGVHATFYVIGSHLDEHPDLLRREVAEGHAINLHSWSHNYKSLYPGRVANAEVIESEYLRTIEAARAILGEEFNTEGWRYPGGHMSWKKLEGADAALASHGVHWVDWNADTRDSAPKKERPTTVEQVVGHATAPIRSGFHVAVILGHDTPAKALTAQSVPAIIKAYQDAGYAFGIIS